jgi:2-alkyl-3-oxoalkanoate reductase
VLVTGGTSLLGAAVARVLLERGDEVAVLQRRQSGLGCQEHLADVRDADAVSAAAAGVDAVVHLAARVSVTGPWSEFVSTNVDGTANVLTAARQAGVGAVVHVSSPSVAHRGESLVGASAGPADPDRTHGSYATSKAVAERMALSAPGLNVVAVRPHLVWGPGDTQLVGRIVARARAGRLALVGTGGALIDTTYVTNAAEALVAALDRAPALAGRAYVVSNGEPRPVGELVRRICAAAGAPPPRGRVPYGLARAAGAACELVWAGWARPDDPPMTRFLAEQLSTAHWFDQRATRVDLGWSPRVTLREGLDLLAEWYRPPLPG